MSKLRFDEHLLDKIELFPLVGLQRTLFELLLSVGFHRVVVYHRLAR